MKSAKALGEIKKRALDDIEKAHPIDGLLFGSLGAVTAQMCQDLSKGFTGKQFDFMDLGEYQVIAHEGRMGKVIQIYWKELLYRVYWAAALNIMRHQRWQAACTRAYAEPANLLAFASSLRGLMEGAQDAWYSLNGIPSTLARDRGYIQSALAGTMQDKHFLNKELEDRLIHFVYGRKLGKTEKEMAPISHLAREPKEYRNAIGLRDDKREMWGQLYDELCGICHPTAFSLMSFWKGDDCRVEIVRPDDSSHILALCQKYGEVINSALSLSVTQSGMCLKVLNWFSLSEIKCPEIDKWNFEDIPAWKKIQAASVTGTVH
jgi:hypothetical protein